ncbi:YkgJ family cysteine cluster protein [Polyangium sp. 15x6]|uniref:YkgJ family cysteine cluster protein n=1 Tax=Polyangium sp. 15x6 TaxID=3042687 RepID=UPI00249B2707|nr:YkgJ family cysteine cluster protein [Polyangium sp. 15x6]MDI3289298.1 YkgJ family cysteine cluster protein [Polyangium sp. 15x6]
MRALRVLQQRDEAIRARVARDVEDRLGEGNLESLALAAHAAMERETTRARGTGARAPACSAGCSYCCHVHAHATLPEILAVAAWLRRSLAPEALFALKERLARHVADVEPLSDEERWAARIPCALLDERGYCSVHEARPLRCRAFHSCSADDCRDAFEGRTDALPPRAALLARAADAVEAGYDRALLAAGIDASGHRLESALLRVLERTAP